MKFSSVSRAILADTPQNAIAEVLRIIQEQAVARARESETASSKELALKYQAQAQELWHLHLIIRNSLILPKAQEPSNDT